MESITILVIDDDEGVRTSLALILHRLGYTGILQAENGMDGLKMVRKYRPRLVTTDLAMPGIQGEQVIRQIALEHKQNFPIKVIAISADGRENVESVVKAAGGDGFLRKPFELEAFRDMVHTLLA